MHIYVFLHNNVIITYNWINILNFGNQYSDVNLDVINRNETLTIN